MFKAIKMVILSLEEIDINIDTDNLWQKCDFTLLHYYSYVFFEKVIFDIEIQLKKKIKN